MTRFIKLIFIFLITLTINNGIAANEIDNLELPSGGNIISGDITINQQSGKLIINQTSEQGVIEWQKFNIGSNASVYFNQSNASSSILNQILDGSRSIILGNIYSNGKLFLNNPNGIA